MSRKEFPDLPQPPPAATQETENGLEKQLEDFRLRVAGKGRVRGLTPEQKKWETEKLLHELRIDRNRRGGRQINNYQSLQYRKYLRFVLQKAEEALAARRG